MTPDVYESRGRALALFSNINKKIDALTPFLVRVHTDVHCLIAYTLLCIVILVLQIRSFTKKLKALFCWHPNPNIIQK